MIVGDEIEEAMLKDDLRSYSHVKAKIPSHMFSTAYNAICKGSVTGKETS